MKRVLVTGAAGFVGANLVRRLVADGHETHALLRPDHAAWRLTGIRSELVVHEGDVEDAASVGRATDRVRPDWIFHLAAHGAYPTQNDLGRMIRTNIAGTAAVIAAGLRVGAEAIVLAGSSSEYGLKEHAPSESEPLEPDSDYAVTKAAATLYGMKEARRSGAKIVTLRLYSVFGPWEAPARFWPTVAMHALEGRYPPLAAAATARDFVYVDDAVEAFILAAAVEHREAVLNIGTGVQTTLADAVDMVRQRIAIPGEPVWGTMAPRAWDTTWWIADSRRAATTLGWTPRRDVRAGFEMLVDWLQADPALPSEYRSLPRIDHGSS